MKISLALLLAFRVFAQDTTPTFRATTELVLVDVQVVHKKMKTTAPALVREHFRIDEEGASQEIKSFSRDELPLSVVLLFDLTDSVRSELRHLAAGAKSALTHLKPEDEVAVMVYAASATLIDDFSTDRERTAGAVDRAARMKSGEAAFFNEAVYQAAARWQKSANPASRRVIIWLTDNLSNVPTEWMRASHGKSVPSGDLHTEQDALRALHESGTVVAPLLVRHLLPFYSMIYASEAPWRGKYPPGDANKYAEWTGGQAMHFGGKNVDDRLAELIDELRSRYTIGFQPSSAKPPGAYCKLHVSLSPAAPLHAKDWNVLARAGYYRK